ncbi:MAG: DDE-type integrase/transposase/recombinase [Verrucomicrobiia bacterium]
MKQLKTDKRVQIIAALVDGVSIRATARICDVAINTVVKLQIDAGKACAKYQDEVMRDLKCSRLQCDEIHSFVYGRDKNLPEDKQGKFGYGSVWTWTAIDADTKLVPCWHVGTRDAGAAYEFIHDLKNRLATRVQLTTDGHKAYLSAIEDAFGSEVDYAMLVKLYGAPQTTEARYAPPVCIGCTTLRVSGNPDPDHISTSYAERQNLTMRMSMRRFTRLTNAHSKKIQNHEHALALYFMYYSFCRIHQTLRVTPAMEAGVADHVWSIEEIVTLLQ